MGGRNTGNLSELKQSDNSITFKINCVTLPVILHGNFVVHFKNQGDESEKNIWSYTHYTWD